MSQLKYILRYFSQQVFLSDKVRLRSILEEIEDSGETYKKLTDIWSVIHRKHKSVLKNESFKRSRDAFMRFLQYNPEFRAKCQSILTVSAQKEENEEDCVDEEENKQAEEEDHEERGEDEEEVETEREEEKEDYGEDADNEDYEEEEEEEIEETILTPIINRIVTVLYPEKT